MNFLMFRLKNYDLKTLWVQIAQVCSALKGPLVLLPVGLLLTPGEQGYWFTMVSLGAAVALADLGFSIMLTQVVAHEFSSMDLRQSYSDMKDSDVSKQAGFISSAIKFYFIFVVIFAVFILFAGLFFFEFERPWVNIWFLHVVSGLLLLCLTFFQAVVNGIDRVESIFQEKSVLAASNVFVTCSLLFLGAGVWALPLGILMSVAGVFCLHWYRHKRFWLAIFGCRGVGSGSFARIKALLPLQGRYALSWLFGYIIFQAFVPIVFKYEGEVLAGRLGLLMTAYMAISNLSGAVVVAKLPQLAKMAANGEEQRLLSMFTGALRKRMVVHVLLVASFMAVQWLALKNGFLGSRLLEFEESALLALIYFPIALFTSWASYIRSHKEEGFVVHAALNAVLVFFAIYIGIVQGTGLQATLFLLVLIYYGVLLPYGYGIYSRSKIRYVRLSYST